MLFSPVLQFVQVTNLSISIYRFARRLHHIKATVTVTPSQDPKHTTNYRRARNWPKKESAYEIAPATGFLPHLPSTLKTAYHSHFWVSGVRWPPVSKYAMSPDY